MTGDLTTTRFPRVDDPTEPIRPINNHDHRFSQHRDARDPLFWRAFTAALAAAILTAIGVAYFTGSAIGLLAIMPGAAVTAMAVVGGRETIRRWRR